MRRRRNERRHLEYDVVRLHTGGESQRGVSRALGIARDTVKRILELHEQRRARGETALEREVGPPRTPRASKLDVFEDKIESWLVQHEDLTAVRLHEKLLAAGFDGGYTIVRERLRQIRRERGPTVEVFEVVETPPGQQAQFDWSPYELEGGLKVQLWSCTLSWSRGRSTMRLCESSTTYRSYRSVSRISLVATDCMRRTTCRRPARRSSSFPSRTTSPMAP